jgi:hydroxymethylbilane synthase
METTLLGVTTEGDRNLDVALSKIGGKALFVKELESAIESGCADIAVHSMKDTPMALPQGFTLAAILEREDARDVFISARYRSFQDLPKNACIGTSSLRRSSQILTRFPNCIIEPLRGNVDTRLRKLSEGKYDAIVLAAAGLKRLGLDHRITSFLEPEHSLPAIGQGALGIECRSDRNDLIEIFSQMIHRPTAVCVRAERAFGLALGGNCQLPLAGYAQMQESKIRLRGFVSNKEGDRFVYGEEIGDQSFPEALGHVLAQRLLDQGAKEILSDLER